jgi:PEGA domain
MKNEARVSPVVERMGRAVLVALALLSSIGVGIASAETGIVAVRGTADDNARQVVQNAFDGIAIAVGWTHPENPLSKAELDRMFACKDPNMTPCLPPAFASKHIDRVLLVTIDRNIADGGAAQLVIVGKLVAGDGKSPTFDRRYCDACADAQLEATAQDLARTLLQKDAAQSGHTMLKIESAPSGAAVTLDGHGAGVTDTELSTYPGHHTIVLEKPGFRSQTDEVDLKDGESQTLSTKLAPSSVAAMPAQPTTHGSMALPLATTIIGGLGVAAGVILYAVDQDPSPTGGKQYWNTAPAGVVTGIAGLVVLGASGYLWYRYRHPSSTPTAALVHGGAVVGWEHRF